MSHSKYQLMPDLTEKEYQALKDDIQKRGVLVPVELDEGGNIMDGHHRIRAWNELHGDGHKIGDYPRIIRAGMTEAEKRNHIRAINCLRRHLTTKQKQEYIDASLKDEPEKSDRQHAEALGVDHKTVAGQRKKLVESGELGKFPNIKAKAGRSYPRNRKAKGAIFANGARQEKTALEAASKIEDAPDHMLDTKRASRIAREQEAEQNRNQETPEKTVVANGKADIRHGDFIEALADIPDNSIPLIFTDPPYPAEFLPEWEKLAGFAARILKPGGVLMAYSGQYHLDKVMGYLGNSLEYAWTIAIVGKGDKSIIHQKHIYSRWKPILIFCKPPYSLSGWADDLYNGQGPQKDDHPWQQGEDEAAYYIEVFSNPGDIVIDPFLGSGTTGVACVKLGRNFVGCDVDGAAILKALERINEQL